MTHSPSAFPTRRLRVLWVSHFVPYPPKGGCFQRSFNLLAGVGRAHEVHLLAIRPKPPASAEATLPHARTALGRHCASVTIVDLSNPALLACRAGFGLTTGLPISVTLFRSREARAAMQRLLSSVPFDVVHFDSISLAEYVDLAGGVPTVMTHHGAESHMMRRRLPHESSVWRKAVFRAEWRALERAERATCPRVDCNVVVSALDREIMSGLAPDGRYVVVENGVALDYFRPLPDVARPSIVFAGRLDQYSNRDGVLHFMETTWPLVVARYPQATIRLIGSNPPARLRALAMADSRVEVPGFVDDVRPYFADAAVAICPVRDGGGTRIKILDALAQSKPIVSTSIGIEGLALEPDRHLLIGDDPETFARQLGRIFDDVPLRRALARDGRAQVEARYSWPALIQRLVGEYGALAAPPHDALPGPPPRAIGVADALGPW